MKTRVMKPVLRATRGAFCGLLLCGLSPTGFGQDIQPGPIHNPTIRYAPPAAIKVFPVPRVIWNNDIAITEIAVISRQLLYPFLNTTPRPVAAIFVQTASHYYPLIAPYDSGDPSVIEYHLLLLKLAGIDGIMVDWYGLSALYDYPVVHRNTQALVESAAQLGLNVGICYEDQTITKLVEAKRLAAADHVTQARRDLQWLCANWFASPTYLKYKDKPVLLSFGSDGLSDAEWEQALHSLDSAPIYLSEHRRRSAADGTFDWPQPSSGVAGLETYYQKAKWQAIFMPVAFSRFHDMYKQAGVQAGFPQIPDEQGRTFAATLERGLQSGAAFVQIATWNDWGEGTNIEPSEEFGYRDLETIQKLRRADDTHFAATPADLRLPYRLWRLRNRPAQSPQSKAKLDAIARLIAFGKGAEVQTALLRLETTPQQAN